MVQSLSEVHVVHGAIPASSPASVLDGVPVVTGVLPESASGLAVDMAIEPPASAPNGMPLMLPGAAPEILPVAPGDSPPSAPKGAAVCTLPPQPMSAGKPSERRSTTVRRIIWGTHLRRIHTNPCPLSCCITESPTARFIGMSLSPTKKSVESCHDIEARSCGFTRRRPT